MDLFKLVKSLTFHSSFLQFSTSVVSCSEAEVQLENNGKKVKVKGYNVKLKDTILFPEGGGQVKIRSISPITNPLIKDNDDYRLLWKFNFCLL